MKLGNIIKDGKIFAVAKTEEGIVSIPHLDRESPKMEKTTDSIVKSGISVRAIHDSIESGKGDSVAINGEYKFEPVILEPEKIICVGLNYRSHVKETNDKIPENPVLFSKFGNSLAGSGQILKIPPETKQLDYEGELGIVIGKSGYRISEDKALDHVFGYFCGNDLSARDLQFKTSQWLLGKTCDNFYPCGPFIITADEIPDPQNLTIKTNLNDEVRQNSSTSMMIFSCRFLISYISRFMTLRPGDIISTGTPEGVILGMPEESRIWIKSKDKVRVEIQGMEALENEFA